MPGSQSCITGDTAPCLQVLQLPLYLVLVLDVGNITRYLVTDNYLDVLNIVISSFRIRDKFEGHLEKIM